MEMVSASEFVRRFGDWHQRALSAPVYIRHHGRTRLVLASVEFMQQLVDAQGRHAAPDGGDMPALLELVDSILLVADADLRMQAMSPAARRHFERADWEGLPLEDLLPDPIRAIMMRSVDHVRAGGLADSFQLRAGPAADRRLDVTVQPHGRGIAIVARDRTEIDARIEQAAIGDAMRQTLGLLGTVAVLRINLRGFIVDATSSFDALTGLGPDAYRSVRVATLFDIASRLAVSDAIERAITTIEPQVIDARLAVNRGAPIELRMALSAETLRSSIDAVIATIVARH